LYERDSKKSQLVVQHAYSVRDITAQIFILCLSK
jgi:hypothetical protein